MSTLVKQIKHLHVIIDWKIRGGKPVITGTGIRIFYLERRL